MVEFHRLLHLSLAVLTACALTWSAHAQRPQDNWYLEQTWTKTGGGLVATNGGLSAPYGVAIGPDGRIYVGDQGYSRIQVYQPDGTYAFSITNGFGGGQSFNQPRGMTFGGDGRLYVADAGRNAVFVFGADGAFVRTIGGVAGSGDGQLSGVIDVGVSCDAEIFVLETGNVRVSVFSTSGEYRGKWAGSGTLDGLLSNPTSLAVLQDGSVVICQSPSNYNPNSEDYQYVKRFSADGIYMGKWSFRTLRSETGGLHTFGPVSVRVDPGGCWGVVQSYVFGYGMAPNGNLVPHYSTIYARYVDGTDCTSWTVDQGSHPANRFAWPCNAFCPDGSMIFVGRDTKSIRVFRRVLRDQWAPPCNAIPMPASTGISQRPNSTLVDIDYRVTDMDDETVTSAVLIFTNTTQTLANCLRSPTLAENTSTNLGPDIAANVSHRLTWNAGADWTTSLGSFRVAILAKDSRQKLLDIHYLDLPAEYGMPALRISRSPLIESDFAQVWWWLLATGDAGIRLTSAKVHGNGGSYDGVQLWDGTTTSASGRAYLYAKMGLREATAAELTWARQASTVPTVEQWSPTRQVAGRPKNVNEYGFDTGNWGANAWWVVPLE